VDNSRGCISARHVTASRISTSGADAERAIGGASTDGRARDNERDGR
jgi:hypothetical protein